MTQLERIDSLLKGGYITEQEAQDLKCCDEKPTVKPEIVEHKPKTMKECLLLVIDYLNGKTDIYAGGYGRVIDIWDSVWDEMKALGYDPESATSIQKYIREQLS